MMSSSARRLSGIASIALAILAIAVVPKTALAYGGPGSIVSGVGALLALVAAVFAAVFGFIWYPMKRLVRLLRARSREDRADVA